MKIDLKKKFRRKNWLVAIAISILTLIITLGIGAIFQQQNVIYIALAGPMTGNYNLSGQQMFKGTQMYIDEVNRNGGVNGKQIKLLKFDDQGKAELAREKAQEIVETTKAIAVIGHFFSESSIATSEIYDRAGIAAITPTATADELTIGNKSYFRLASNNSLQGSFLANYVKSILLNSTATIVYDTRDKFTLSLMEGFSNAFIGLEGKIKHRWDINDFGQTKEEQYEQISREFLKQKNEDPGMILVALRSQDAVNFIVSLKRKNLDYPIIGGDNLAGDDIGNIFNIYPEEKAHPGYFSNHILAPVSLIFDLAEEKAQQFRNKYLEKYQVNPSWRTAVHYNAATILVEAIKKAEVKGNSKNIAKERQLVRDSLASFNSKENAVEGLDNLLYFDDRGDGANTLTMGVFENQKFISAFTQLYPIPDIKVVADFDKKLANGEILIVNNQYMQKTNVIYTGIDLNEIRNLDQKNSSYTAEFYLWFRYRGDLDASNIEFTNYSVERLDSGEKLELSEPIETETVDGVTYRLYRMNADFKEQFLFDDYPFDRQKISIKFRHAYRQRDNLIYVVDVLGLQDISSQGILKKLAKSEVFSTITDWQIKSADIFQDIIKDDSTLGKKELVNTDAAQEYSRFNIVVRIERNFLSFSLKNLLPLLFLILISYLLLFLPFDDISVEAVSGILLAVVFFHLSLLSALPEGVGYVVALDYAFYVIYGLIVLQMVMVVMGKRAQLEYHKNRISKLQEQSRVLYVVMLAIATFSLTLYYKPIDFPEASGNATMINSASESPGAESKTGTQSHGQITLKLGYLPTDYQPQINRVLAIFNAKHPLIKVESEPANVAVSLEKKNQLDYQTFLGSLLKQGAATDLLLVEPFALGKELFRTRYLETLDIREKSTNFPQPVLNAWSTTEGELYALPLFATVRGGIYYNTEIFRQLNLEIPTTWEGLLETAWVLENNGYIPFANGSTDGKNLMDEVFLNILPNFLGGDRAIQQYLQGDRCFNDEGVVAAFKAIADLGKFLATPQQASNYYDNLNLFAEGKAAMWFDNSGSVPLLKSYAPEGEWSVFPVPAPVGQSEYVRLKSELGVAINANSPYKQQAREFIQWLSTKEAAQVFARELPGLFPFRTMDLVKGDRHSQAFIELIDESPWVNVGWGLKILGGGLPDGYSLMRQGVLGVLAGEVTPGEAANALQRGLAKWLKPAQTCKK